MSPALLLLAAALPTLAATWTPPEALGGRLEDEGQLILPAGIALRLEPGPKADLPLVEEIPSALDPETGERVVVDGPGRPLDLRGVEQGLLLPAAETTRLLRVMPQGGPLRIRTTTRREQLTAWVALQRKLNRARPAQLDELILPWGQAATLAELRLRARAVQDRPVRALGTTHDLAALEPLHRTTHAATSRVSTTVQPGQAWTQAVEGPATAVLRVRPRGPRPGAWVRGEAVVGLDGEELRRVALAGAGAQEERIELFLPPGVHRLELLLPELRSAVSLELAQPRQPLLGARLAGPGYRANDSVSTAELAWLRGRRDEAREAFRPLVEEAGPVGELARLRMLRLATEEDELLALARLPAWLSDDGVEAAVDALLDRAGELPPDLVEAAVLRAAEPDLAKVAAWLEDLGGQRPRGMALLEAAQPLVDDGRDLPAAALRHRTLRTRFTDLEPAGLAAPQAVLREAGPGSPRVLVPAGEGVALQLPRWGERRPVLRLLVEEPTRWTLDGRPWDSPPSELAMALEPGPHRIEVQEGRLILQDREVVEGGRVAHEVDLYPLPATWMLPDPGVRVDLRLVVDPPVPVRVQLDDGAIRDLLPDGRGIATLTAGAWVESLRVEPLDDPGQPVTAAVQLRTRLPGLPPTPPQPITDVDAALAELSDLSRAIDLGYDDARLARAALLGRMGLLSMARRDLRVLAAGDDPELRDQARTLDGSLLPATPSAPAVGPLDATTALVAHGLELELPPGPSEARARALEAAAESTGEAALWAAAARAWDDVGQPVHAWQAAEQAGRSGNDLQRSLEARTAWTWLRYAEGGVGLVRVPEVPEDPTEQPLWRRARQAMLTPPWPREGEEPTVLRGQVSELLRLAAGDLRLDLYCRDEDGLGEPCTVPLRLDQQHSAVVVPDGAQETLLLPLGSAAELEIGGPGDQHALVLRATVDQELVGGPVLRTALRASPSRPVRVVVGGPLLLRISSLRGDAEVRLQGERVGAVAPGKPLVLALSQPGPQQVEVRGNADLRLHVGGQTREALPPPAPLELPEDTALPVDRDALFEKLAAPPLPELRAPGGMGSVELGLGALSDLVYTPRIERWGAGEATGDWMRAGRRWWTRAGAWARGPQPAGGLRVEGGPTWSGGFAKLQADAAMGMADRGSAGEVGTTLGGRQDLGLGRSLALRLEARLRAAWLTQPADIGPVDNRAWSSWRADHPVHGVGKLSLVGGPSRDLRWELGLQAVSNTAPSLDRLGPLAAVDLLLPAGTVLSADARVELRFADEHREEQDLGGLLRLHAEHGVWESEQRWWRPWAELGWRIGPRALVGAAGLRLLLGPRRGLRDLPPGSVAFRSLRELP